MSEATPIVLTMDGDSDPVAAAELAKVFLSLGVEATLMLSASTAKTLTPDHPLTDAAKRLDVGLVDRELGEPEASEPSLFKPRFEALHDAVLFAAGRLPSCYMPQGRAATAGLGMYATLSEINIRAVVGMNWAALKPGAYFLGGRLHLPGVIQMTALESEAAVEAAYQQVLGEVALGEGDVPVTVPVTGTGRTTAEGLRLFLKRLLDTSSLAVRSVRQAADQWADIPYDHAIPMAAITAMAEHAAQGALTPYRYALGFLSPAEQLYIFAHCWWVALEKGKAPRNAQTRTPIPTLQDFVESTTTTLSAAEFPSLVAKLRTSLEGRSELPAAVELEEGVVAVQDLLPTFAAAMGSMPAPADFQIMRGAATFAPEAVGFGRLAWTYKPAVR
jgi:hypothetical protein